MYIIIISIIIIIIIITIFIERTNSSKFRVAGVVRWGTWLVGKRIEVSFETAFRRTNGW